MNLFLTLFLLLTFVISCNAELSDNFYEPAKANLKIAEAFAIKDASCGTSHRLTQFILGRAKISDVEACIKQINEATCQAWSVSNPTPSRCRSINFQF